MKRRETNTVAGCAMCYTSWRTPAKREALSGLLTEWAEEMEAIEPEPNPDYVPWPEREPCGHFAADASGGGSI
jgi:hypothetical protein